MNNIMSNEKGRRLIKNTFIVGVGSIASKGIIFLMTPLFSRWLSIEDYASFDLITTYTSLLLPFCTLSISEAVFRFLLDDVREDKPKTIISSGFFMSLAGYSIFLFLYWIGSILWDRISFGWPVCVLLLAQMFFAFFSEVARGIKRVELYSVFSLISVVLLSTFSTVFMLVFKWGLSGIVLGYSIAYFISAIGLLIATKTDKLISLKDVNIHSVREMLVYSWPLVPNSISWWVVNVSDRLIINSVIGLTANGIYAIANKIPAIVNVLFSVFHISWVQSASETVCDDDYAQYCNEVLNKLVPFIFSAVTVIISGNFLFYQYFFDVKYAEAYYYSPILIFAAGISCICQFMGGIMIAKKETRQNGATNIVAALSNIIINLLMVQRFGLYAASVSTLVSYLILLSLRYAMIQRHVRLRMNKFSALVILLSGVVFAGVYFNNLLLNVVLFFSSMVFFLMINKDMMRRVLRMLARK